MAKFNLIKYTSIIILVLLFGAAFCQEVIWMKGLKILPSLITMERICFLGLWYSIVLLILLYLLEGVAVGRRRLLDLFFGFFISSFFLNLILLIIQIFFVSRLWKKFVIAALIMIALETICGAIWILLCHKIFSKYHFGRQAVFIYGNREDEQEYVRVNNTINMYFKISTSVDFHRGQEYIMSVIKGSPVIFLGDIPTEIRNNIIKYCQERKIECFAIPKISDIYTQNAEVVQINDKLLFKYPYVGIFGLRKIIKRAADIFVSLLLIIITSPVLLAAAIAIKLEDGGEIFFRQERITIDMKPFMMYKLRSMRPDAEKGGARLSYDGDDRVTNIGRKLRKYHIDEIPQLINVLKGDMAIVGPRPEREGFIRQYMERIPEFAERLKVKGGLTGYAQVYGRYNTEPEDKIKYDLYYIYSYSLWMDVKLVILTIRILFQKENTQGVRRDQINALRDRGGSKN